jgi:hypothetical protein
LAGVALVLTTALATLFPEQALAKSWRLFFRWGDEQYDAQMRRTAAEGSGGRPYLNRKNFDDIRSRYKPKSSDNRFGSGFYMADDLWSSASFGGNLTVVYVEADGDIPISGMPDQAQVNRDSQYESGKLESYPLICGPYEADVHNKNFKPWYISYRAPNGDEQARGIGIQIFNAEDDSYGVSGKAFDQLSGGSDQGKIHLLGRLAGSVRARRVGKPMTRSTEVFFHRMVFDHGSGFLNHYLDVAGERYGASKWHSEIVDSLLAFIQIIPDDRRTADLKQKWLRMPGALTAGHLRHYGLDPGSFIMMVRALDADARKAVMTEFLTAVDQVITSDPEGYRNVSRSFIDLSEKIADSELKGTFLSALGAAPQGVRAEVAVLAGKLPELRAALEAGGPANKLLIDEVTSSARNSWKGWLPEGRLVDWLARYGGGDLESQAHIMGLVASTFLEGVPDAYDRRTNGIGSILAQASALKPPQRARFFREVRAVCAKVFPNADFAPVGLVHSLAPRDASDAEYLAAYKDGIENFPEILPKIARELFSNPDLLKGKPELRAALLAFEPPCGYAADLIAARTHGRAETPSARP